MATRKTRDPNKGSEYGGTDSLIQPSPHDWENTPREKLIAIHQRKALATGDFLVEDNMADDLLPPSTDQYRSGA